MPMRSRTLRPPPASWPRWLCPSCRCWSRACHPPLFVDLATAVPPAAAGAAPGHSGAKPRAACRSLVTVPIIRQHRALRIAGPRRPILSRCRRGKGCLKAKEAYRPGTPWRHLRARSSRPATSRCSPPWSPRTSTACGASASGAPTARARLVATGEISAGMFVVLAGEVAITQHNALGRDEAIITHGPGAFIGELSQLSGRPSLVDAHAAKPVEALVIPPRRLRDVLVAEAELGERIMRALIQ